MTDTSVPSLGAWKGASYERMNDDDKVTDTAMVYRNEGASKKTAFTATSSGLTETGSDTGVYTAPTAADMDIASTGSGTQFAEAGTKTHTTDKRTVSGTYKGAPGTYNCPVASCTSKKSAAGITLMGGWTFTPSSDAMLTEKDPDYLFFGWWLNTDADGMPQMASAFRGMMGTGISALPAAASGIGGTAKYSGSAAGKFAYYNPLDKSGDAGHFTADVELTAKFEASHDNNAATNDTGGVTGAIDGFMANGKSVPWSVELKRAGWDGTTSGVFGAQTGADGPMAKTVWSINDNPANASGSWSGQMYDEAGTDGSDVPTTAVGVFESMYGSTHHMVGGFGVTKDK